MSGISMRGSERLVLTGVGGIALFGNAICRYTDFRCNFTRTFHKGRGGIAWTGLLPLSGPGTRAGHRPPGFWRNSND